MPAKDLVPFSTYLPGETKQKLEARAKINDRSAAGEARRILVDHFTPQEWEAPNGQKFCGSSEFISGVRMALGI